MSRRSGEVKLDLRFNESLTWYDYAVEWVLGIALVLSPLAYGSTNSWSQEILYALIGVVALLAGARMSFVRGTRFVFTWAYLPMLLYLALVTISVIPLPAGFIQVVSPGTYEEKSRLMADLPNASQLLSKLTISFNVWTTLRGLRLLLAVSVLFTVIVNIYRTPAQIKRLLATVAMSGLLVTLVALAQNLTHDQGQPYRIFWNLPFISTNAVHPHAGPFAGKAQLGQYLNLTIGAMVALALVLIAESFEGEDPGAREILEKLGSSRIRIAILLLLSAPLAASAILWSYSRGAMLGLAIATVISVCLLLSKRGWRGRETVILINAVFVLMVVAVFAYVLLEPHLEKMSAMAGSASRPRLMLIRSMVPMFHTWPVMGTGLESFEWIFPLFQPADQGGFFGFAENDYAQTLTDTGIIGGVLVLVFVAAMIFHWVGAFRGRRAIHLASIGIALSLIAIMAHSFSDFSQHASGIATVTSVLLGLTVSLHRLSKLNAGPSKAESPSFGWSPWPRLALAVVMVSAMSWAVWSLNNLRRAETLIFESDPGSSSFKTPVTDPNFQAELDAYYDPAIADDAEACRLDPTNVLYIHWLNHFRWRKLSSPRDPKTTAYKFPPNAIDTAKQIVEELTKARILCPSYGHVYTLLGKIQWELFDKAEGIKNLKKGLALRPFDPEPNFYLAVAAASEDRWDEAQRFAREAVRLDGSFGQLVMDYFGSERNRNDIVADLMRNEPGYLTLLLNRLKDNPAEQPLVQNIKAQLLKLARDAADKNPRDPRNWASLAENLISNQAPNGEVIIAYTRALDLEYGNLGWRIRLAQLLKAEGKREEAVSQAEICLRIDQQMAEAKALLASLRGLPAPEPAP